MTRRPTRDGGAVTDRRPAADGPGYGRYVLLGESTLRILDLRRVQLGSRTYDDVIVDALRRNGESIARCYPYCLAHGRSLLRCSRETGVPGKEK